MDELNSTVISLIKNAKSLDESLDVLSKLLSGGFAVWKDGSLYEIKNLVDKVGRFKVEVRSDEHPPPHFHLTGGRVNASFTIEKCECFRGRIYPGDAKIIQFWYNAGGREKLISAWNSTRPTDCPVGKFVEYN